MSGICTVVAGSACRAIVQCLPHAVVLVDEQLRVVLANRAAAALFGRSSERMRGVPITELVRHGNLSDFLLEFGHRRTKVMETTLPRRSGVLTVSVTAVKLAYWGARRRGVPGGRREFRLLLLQDLTEKALLEQQLIETEKQAAIGQLAAGILHEVTNPLNSLASNLLFVRSTLGGSSAPEVGQALDLSLEQLDEVRQMLGTLSAASRRPPRYVFVDLHDVIRRCAHFVAREAERRCITIELALGPSALPCEIDDRLMKQVLLNLLKNSMEAMPDGGRIDVRTGLRFPDADEPPAVVVEVEDTGNGIPEADLRKAFRPLFTTKPGGAGLGLSFCRQVVEEHGGSIRLGRGRARGTIATLVLPLHQGAVGTDSGWSLVP